MQLWRTSPESLVKSFKELNSAPNCASLSAIAYFLCFGPRFQNWDLRIRPLGGNFTENLIFRSNIADSSVQRPKLRKTNPINFEIYVLFVLFYAAERLAQLYLA